MRRGLSLREGGWVLIGAAILFLAILAWAMAPAVLRLASRPPGDGATLSSYEFDLTNVRLPETAVLQPAMLHRDMIPVLDAPPSILTAQAVLDRAGTREKYLVDDDSVIGVEIGGEARAYPISVLHVHELIHDELGGVPIVVTWHWPSASPVVFDRRVNGEVRRFGASGLVAGGNQVLYLRRTDGNVGGESLYSQLLGRSITGPPQSLTTIPCRFTGWPQWREAYPDTTVAGRDEALKKRYKHGDPTAYYVSGGLIYDTPVPEDGLEPKEPVALVGGRDRHVRLVTGRGELAEEGWEVIRAARRQPPRLVEANWNPRREDDHDDTGGTDGIDGTDGIGGTDGTDAPFVRHTLWHTAHALGLTPPVAGHPPTDAGHPPSPPTQ
ncbi:MAG: DUF3179 domain-containing (seleno)protein [Phycisphaerales bacterium]|jgi:hypothetical protein|nr:DUF3179 domain-containing (seleno)protein [Phycisphaerales bacterium]